MHRRHLLRSRLALTSLEARETPAVVGGLDTTYNPTGLIPGALALSATAGDRINAIAPLPDGRFVAVGRANGAGNTNMLILRLLADGTVDSSFNGGTGRRVIDFNGGNDEAFAVGVNNNRIVVAGAGNFATAFDFVVARMTLDGAPDNTFDTDGQRDIRHGGTNFARSIGFLSDGTIVLAGSTTGGASGAADMAIVRVNPANGKTLPADIATDMKQLDLSSGDEQAFALLVEPGDTIVVGGQVGTTGNTSFGAARLAADLANVVSLRAVAGLTGANRINALALQPDNNILFAGTDGNSSTADIIVGRLKTDLSRDTAGFNSAGSPAGLLRIDAGGQDTATAVQRDDFNRILVSGFSKVATADNNAVVVARLTTAGAFDTSFSPEGVAGLSVFPFSGVDEPVSVTGATLARTGRLLVVGNTTDVPAAIGVTTQLALTNRVGVGGSPNGSASVFAASTSSPVPSLVDTTSFFANTAIARLTQADLNFDGVPELIAGTGAGAGNQIVVLDGATRTELVRFNPFESSFSGGVYVAAGDVNGDGRADVVVTPDQTGGPIVVVYSGAKIASKVGGEAAQTLRYKGILGDDNYRGGLRPAVGDVDGDGKADIMVSAGLGGGPRIALFNGAKVATAAQGLSDAATEGLKLVADFFAYEASQRAGAFVALGDVTGDGRADLLFGGGPAGGPRIRLFDASPVLAAATTITTLDGLPGAAQLANFFAGDPNSRGGVRVAMADFDGDNRADLVTGSGTGLPARMRIYLGKNAQSGNAEPTGGTDVAVLGGGVLSDGVYVG